MEKNILRSQPMLSKKFVSATLEYSDWEREVPAPYMRRSFELASIPECATLTVCALGFYRLFVNGQEITRTRLAPYVTNPDQLLVYDLYDIKDRLTVGKNTLGFILGGGFQNNFGGFIWLFQEAPFRSAPKLAFALEYVTDGEKTLIEADENVLTHPSPIVWDDFRVGVRYDARAEIADWASPVLDDGAWAHAIRALPHEGERVISDVTPIRVRKERHPVAIWREGDAFIYDFGINDTGLTRLRITGERGRKITVLHGETLIDGKFSQENLLFTKTNKKAVGMPAFTQRMEYILRGEGEESYSADFTYFGFRYARVEGITEEEATPELLTYLVMSTDLAPRGEFSTGNTAINTLECMSRRATISNFQHYPLDCPHREKNGWTGDAALSAEQTMLRFDPTANYRLWLHAMCNTQNREGAISCIVPTSGWGYEWGNGPAWDRAMIELPYQAYRLRGDLSLMKVVETSVMKYFAYLKTRLNVRGLLAIGLDDWVAPENAYKPPLEFTDSTVTYDMARKAALMFRALGKEAEARYAEDFATELRAAIRRELLDSETMTFARGEQSSQAMAVYYGLCDSEEEKRLAVEVLVSEINRHGGHMSVGILGHKALFRVLSEYGYDDLAVNMIVREDAPSYGVMLKEGYTCLSECITGKLQSLNHHMWGDISAYFMEYFLGMRINPEECDVKRADIAPHFPSALPSARGYHLTPFGRIDVTWERHGENIHFTLGYPGETTGSIIAPDGYAFAAGEKVKPAKPGTYTFVKTS